MKTIWKYEVELNDSFVIKMPEGAEILSVQYQGKSPQIWALVDSKASEVERKFRVIGTGHEIEDGENLSYIDTFQIPLDAGNDHLPNGFVFHVFEVV